MNRQVHLVIGVGLFLVYVYITGLFHNPAGELFVFGIIAVAAGSLFPDILEPAISPRHRGIFHSRRALKVVGVLFLLTTVPVLLTPALPRSPPRVLCILFLPRVRSPSARRLPDPGGAAAVMRAGAAGTGSCPAASEGTKRGERE